MPIVANFEIEYLQYLGTDGRLLNDDLPEFAKDKKNILELFKQMLFVRSFDTKAVALQIQPVGAAIMKAVDGALVVIATATLRAASGP